MTIDRIMAVLALATFAAFLAIVAIKVGRIDLGVVCAAGILLAGYDLWLQLGPRRRR
jgi:predicted acyltransferase